MQAFCILGIIVVSGAKELNRNRVVIEGMDLGESEVFPDAEVNEDGLVSMKTSQCILEKCNCVGGVCWVLS